MEKRTKRIERVRIISGLFLIILGISVGFYLGLWTWGRLIGSPIIVEDSIKGGIDLIIKISAVVLMGFISMLFFVIPGNKLLNGKLLND